MNESEANFVRRPASTRVVVCRTSLRSSRSDALRLGIRKYAITTSGWAFGQVRKQELDSVEVEQMVQWKPDGLILLSRPSEVPELLELPDLPTVVVDLASDCPDEYSWMRIDEAHIGRIAAQYFLSNGFEHFAMVISPRHPPFSQLRQQGFEAALKEEGYSSCSFQIRQHVESPWLQNPEILTWLRELPKPVAVYCVNDAIAQVVLTHCGQAGVRVPSEVSLMGTDNSLVSCLSQVPNLSTIQLPFEQMGVQAAALLDQMMKAIKEGNPMEPVHRVLEMGAVVERQSTSVRAIPNPAIAKAVQFLREQAVHGATVSQAAKEAGVNRRTLERGFQEYLRTSPGDYINQVRIDRAKELLRETNLRMWEVADLVGMSPRYFNTLFRKSVGQTPRSYRKQHVVKDVSL